MRKRLISIASVALLLVPASAWGTTHVRVDRQAEADWLIPTEVAGHYKWYSMWVWAYQQMAEEPERIVVLAARGTCEAERFEGGWSTSCMGRGTVKIASPEEFQMDPLMQSASLATRIRGQAAKVQWVASSSGPGVYQASEGCSDGSTSGEGEGGGAVSWATAAGKLFGRGLAEESRYDNAMLWEGAMVTECEPPWARSLDLDDLETGDVVRLHQTFTSSE